MVIGSQGVECGLKYVMFSPRRLARTVCFHGQIPFVRNCNRKTEQLLLSAQNFSVNSAPIQFVSQFLIRKATDLILTQLVVLQGKGLLIVL